MIWPLTYSPHQQRVIMMLQSVLTQGKKIMSAQDDLNVAVGALQVSAQNAVNVIATELKAIADAVATANTVPPAVSAQIEASVQNINSIVAGLNAAVASVPVANT